MTRSISATEPVMHDAQAARLLGESGLTPLPQRHMLRGIANELTVYEIP